MQALEKNLRNQLERTVKQARQVAEAAAQAALEQLGAGESHAPAYLDEAGRELRRRLRSHGRQLGDVLQADGSQSSLRLREEIAYEHWHRMLFARFLEKFLNEVVGVFAADSIYHGASSLLISFAAPSFL